ncbi:DUF484 family protein [Albimonas pacifica]|uniref:DUF484 domain-containing protein n=1 Tax=Albimonas pacifica TaxID=1114924 RepID=A0A1I3FFJ8_9RHOB|nr:DUF484 family protein [Albimonas pacifica]SFI10013.1 hypothetical protein SAMN05216258_104255 [Albimonas pacifica]
MGGEEGKAVAPAAATEADVEALREAVLAAPEAVLADEAMVHALLRAHEVSAGSRQVVDLRGALVDRLENRLGRLEETHRSVVAAAYDNLAVTESIHRAALAVLEPDDLEGVLHVLSRVLPPILGVDLVRVGVEREGAGDPPQPPLTALGVGGVARYMGADEDGPFRPVVLRATGPDCARLYGPEGVHMGSEALVRLEVSGDSAPGLLAFGARDAQRFGPDQAGDLLEFLGAVVARALRPWIQS